MTMENVIPTDSVLRRHYEATQNKTTSQNSASQSSGGGLMCWLKRLFGG